MTSLNDLKNFICSAYQKENGRWLHITSHGIETECKENNLGNLKLPCTSLIHERTKEFGREEIIKVSNVYLYVHI